MIIQKSNFGSKFGNFRMAVDSRRSKVSGGKAEQYVFNWYIFTGNENASFITLSIITSDWDYSIGNSETATNASMAVLIKLRVLSLLF